MGNKIYVILGRSCVGKDSVKTRLITHSEKLNFVLKPIKLYSTREKLSDNNYNKKYIFVTEEEYKNALDKELVIYKEVHDTPESGEYTIFMLIDEQLDLRTGSYVVIGNFKTYDTLVGVFGEDCVTPIYLELSKAEAMKRCYFSEQANCHPNYDRMCKTFVSDSEEYSDAIIEKYDLPIRLINTSTKLTVEYIIDYLNNDDESKVADVLYNFTGAQTNRENLVGICNYSGHRGYISKSLLCSHQCIEKECRHFRRFNKEYWKKRDIEDTKNKKKKEKDLKAIELEKRNMAYLETQVKEFLCHGEKIHITNITKDTKGNVFVSYISREFVDLTCECMKLRYAIDMNVVLKGIPTSEDILDKLLPLDTEDSRCSGYTN